MLAVFRTNVIGRIEDVQEPTVYTSTGTAIEVEGKTFVRMSHGTLLVEMDESWSTSAAASKRRAAAELDAAAARISAKADALRAEADAS